LLTSLFIDRSNNLEIEERAVKNLHQKVTLKLLEGQALAQNHAPQIGQLLDWVNRRQKEASQGAL
jgi:hypothetical protein